MFYTLMGIQKYDETQYSKNIRVAVRAIIMKDGKLLLIQSCYDDYKFPGGGVEGNESHEEALKREVAEEAGYTQCVVKEKIGMVIEKQIDQYMPSAIFEMHSHYYICEVTGEKGLQKLDDYESEQNFTPRFVTIDEAICQNERVAKQSNSNGWIERETYVLKELAQQLLLRNNFS
ncbi:NUDIX hydrolase [Bacillus salitolerans]|uniref:NUDIX hydrolase n=1 Tax=Bacillus salitolerans TaxID=1437434 RepID=A0ABW4LS47_9BACI